MKSVIFAAVLFIAAIPVFGQKIYTVGILPFETLGDGVSSGDAAEATRLVIAELSPCSTLTVLPGDQAKNGEYIIQGQIYRLKDQIVLSASTKQAKIVPMKKDSAG